MFFRFWSAPVGSQDPGNVGARYRGPEARLILAKTCFGAILRHDWSLFKEKASFPRDGWPLEMG